MTPCDGAQGWPIRRMSAETVEAPTVGAEEVRQATTTVSANVQRSARGLSCCCLPQSAGERRSQSCSRCCTSLSDNPIGVQWLFLMVQVQVVASSQVLLRRRQCPHSVEKICSCSECRALSNKGSAPVDLGTLRRYHGLCDWKAPYKSERSGRNAIPCSGWARSFTGGTCGFADDRNASTISSSGSVLVCGQ